MSKFWLARHIYTGDLLLFDPDAPQPSKRSIRLQNLSTGETLQLWNDQLAIVLQVLRDSTQLRRAVADYQGRPPISLSDPPIDPRERRPPGNPPAEMPDPAGPAGRVQKSKKSAARFKEAKSNSAVKAISEGRSISSPQNSKRAARSAGPVYRGEIGACSPEQSIRELKAMERRQAQKEAERQMRRQKSLDLVPEHEEGVPTVDWATDEDIKRIRRNYGK